VTLRLEEEGGTEEEGRGGRREGLMGDVPRSSEWLSNDRGRVGYRGRGEEGKNSWRSARGGVR